MLKARKNFGPLLTVLVVSQSGAQQKRLVLFHRDLIGQMAHFHVANLVLTANRGAVNVARITVKNLRRDEMLQTLTAVAMMTNIHNVHFLNFEIVPKANFAVVQLCVQLLRKKR